jgi:hypothetical protein
MHNSITLILAALLGAAAANAAETQRPRAKFEPPPGKVIVFAGQDNASVGGNGSHTDGYADNIAVPGGITHYVYMAPGWKNAFGHSFPEDKVAGLNHEFNWGAGPMSMKAYLGSATLRDCLLHLSISMEGNSEAKVADGSCDHMIDELAEFLKTHRDRAFLLRPGYEFDGSWNAYDPANFKLAFRRIVDRLRSAKATNFATVMASSGSEPEGRWEEYWPGDEYVDWIGYSYWGQQEAEGAQALAFARRKGRPVFIAEATPRGIFLDRTDGPEAWDKWFKGFFAHIDANIDVIRAISYINCHWDAQEMWTDWGNSRLEVNGFGKKKWLEEMAKARFVEAEDRPLKLIGFEPAPAQR